MATDTPTVQRTIESNPNDHLISGVRAATNQTADQTNEHSGGIVVTFDITAVPGATTVTLSIEDKDPVSGKYVAVLTGAAEVAVATRQYTLHPGIVEAANSKVALPLPRTWRIKVTHSGAGNFTYSVGWCLIP